MDMMDWFLVIRVNYKEKVILITIQKSFFVKHIVLIFFSSQNTFFFEAYCFNFFSHQNRFFVQDIVLIFRLKKYCQAFGLAY